MEINFITGKGGVGKSAVAAAMAVQKAKSGMKTILVELGDQSFFQDYFLVPTVNYKPTGLQLCKQSLDVSLWTGQECLKEYAMHILKIQSLYHLFFENAVSRALINVAPALPELAILGKITSGPPRNVGPKMPYDCIVVDAYASGHFSALLRAPAGLAQAVRFGPMGEQVRSIDAVLKDNKICNYYVVALPEELPIIEGLELAQSIEDVVRIKPKMILNKMLSMHSGWQKKENKTTQELQPFVDYIESLSGRQKQMLKRLNESSFSSFTLPWVLKNEAEKVIEALAQKLDEGGLQNV